jgi:hypothetical protein
MGGDMQPQAMTTRPVEVIAQRRAELHESMIALEAALAASAHGRRIEWAAGVSAALERVALDVERHIDATEGPDGMYAEVLADSPRLVPHVRRLTEDHAGIRADVQRLTRRLVEVPAGDDLAIASVREDGTDLLARLSKHRQRGADLVHQAYEIDLGGG